jgi:putative peptidoglycan lipid II flippase
MKRFLTILHQEIKGVHQAAYILGFFAFLSQLLALFRDRLLASSFGAGSTLDIYYASFRLPDLIFVSVASMVSISVLIPFFTDNDDADNQKNKELLSSISTVFGVLMVLICVLGYFLIPRLTGIILPGITDPARLAQLVTLSRLLLLSPLFLGFSNLLASVTQTYKRFFLYALSPIVYNACIIFGIVYLYPHYGITGVVYGVIVGALLHLAIQIPFVSSRGMFPRPTWKVKWQSVKKVFLLSIPRTFTLSANNISLICVTSFASLMAAGSISIFNFSLNLQSVPLSIIGVSYSLAAFPTLAKLFNSGNRTRFVEQVTVAARHIIFLSLPVISLFIVLRAQIVRTILGHGHFDWQDTRLTAACLALFTISLIAQGLNLLFVRAYYAGGNTKKPLFINLATTVFDIGLPFLFIQLFHHSDFFRYFIESLFKVEDIPGTVVLMLPLGYSLGELINLAVFWWYFEKDFQNFSKPLFKTLWESLSASVIVGFVAYSFLGTFAKIFDLNTLLGIFLQGFCAGVLGLLAGVLVLMALKNREFSEVYSALHSKIWKTENVVASEQGDLNV